MKDEYELEDQINKKGLNAPRLTPTDIDNLIVSTTFSVLPSGKVMICELTLQNGFSVRGEAAVVSIENFDHDIGKKISFENARENIWQLAGYALQERLYWAAKEITT